MITADDIIKAARAQIGTRFVHQGRIPGKALDCSGLAAIVAKQIGIDYNDVAGYSRYPSNGTLEYALDTQPNLITVKNKQAGDILLFCCVHKVPDHVGIFTGDTIIHSYAPNRMVCEHRLDEKWEKSIYKIYRINGLDK